MVFEQIVTGIYAHVHQDICTRPLQVKIKGTSNPFRFRGSPMDRFGSARYRKHGPVQSRWELSSAILSERVGPVLCDKRSASSSDPLVSFTRFRPRTRSMGTVSRDAAYRSGRPPSPGRPATSRMSRKAPLPTGAAIVVRAETCLAFRPTIP